MKQVFILVGTHVFLCMAALAGVLLATPDALGQECRLPPTAEDLLSSYPGLQVQKDPDYDDPGLHSQLACVRSFFGRPMSGADNPKEAAHAWMMGPWMDRDNNAFGVEGLDLQMVGTNGWPVGHGPLTVFKYQQYIGGKQVVGYMARLLVLNGDPCRVVYVGARLCHPPGGGFRVDTIDAPTALAIVQGVPEYSDLTEWSTPELVVYAGERYVPAVRTWAFTGSNPNEPRAFRFYVDAADGRLVYVQDEIEYADIAGHVRAYATPGTLPDVPYNPPVLVDLPGAHVYVSPDGVPADYCDTNGLYLLADVGTDPVTVRADLQGEWVKVISKQCPALMETQESITPPAWVEFTFNDQSTNGTWCTRNGTDGYTAQVNAFVHITGAHDWYKVRQPEFTGMDWQVPCEVNSLWWNYCQAGTWASAGILRIGDGALINSNGVLKPECANLAYSTILAHEYAHLLACHLDICFLSTCFGEGFSDAFAILIYNDPIIARDGRGPGMYARDIAAANKRFPLYTGERHETGMLLAGVWWDLKLAMEARYGADEGLSRTQQLFTDWSQATVGPHTDNPGYLHPNAVFNGSPAHPLTATEVLEVDDDDGNLCSNGTPHADILCQVFAAHCIACPRCLVGGDCNSNGIFDACEPDCNTNGLPDGCDIAAGTSGDCNTNGIPDECDLQDRLYGITGSGEDSVLHTLDATDVEVTWAGPANGAWPHAFGLTSHPVTRELYALVGVGKDGDCVLAKADAASGGLTKLGTNAPFPCLNDLAFAGDGTLYGLAARGKSPFST